MWSAAKVVYVLCIYIYIHHSYSYRQCLLIGWCFVLFHVYAYNLQRADFQICANRAMWQQTNPRHSFCRQGLTRIGHIFSHSDFGLVHIWLSIPLWFRVFCLGSMVSMSEMISSATKYSSIIIILLLLLLYYEMKCYNRMLFRFCCCRFRCRLCSLFLNWGVIYLLALVYFYLFLHEIFFFPSF